MRHNLIVVTVKTVKIGVHLRKLSQIKTGVPLFWTTQNIAQKLAYHGVIVDWKPRTVLPVYEEVWGIVIIVVTWGWSTK